MRDRGFIVENLTTKRHGNSLALVIPTLVCQSLKIERGTPFQAEVIGDKIIFTKEKSE